MPDDALFDAPQQRMAPAPYAWELRPCRAGHCTRKVKDGIAYCCGPCADSWEATPRYEPHAHTEPCDQRHAERSGRAR